MLKPSYKECPMQPSDPTAPISDERKAEVLNFLDQASKWSDLAKDVTTDLRTLKQQNLLDDAQSTKVFNLLFDAPAQNTGGENPPLTPEQEKYRKGYTDGIIGSTIKNVTLEDAYDWRYSRDPSELPKGHAQPDAPSA